MSDTWSSSTAEQPSGLVKRHNIRQPVLTLPDLLLATGTTLEGTEHRPTRKAWMQQIL